MKKIIVGLALMGCMGSIFAEHCALNKTIRGKTYQFANVTGWDSTGSPALFDRPIRLACEFKRAGERIAEYTALYGRIVVAGSPGWEEKQGPEECHGNVTEADDSCIVCSRSHEGCEFKI